MLLQCRSPPGRAQSGQIRTHGSPVESDLAHATAQWPVAIREYRDVDLIVLSVSGCSVRSTDAIGAVRGDHNTHGASNRAYTLEQDGVVMLGSVPASSEKTSDRNIYCRASVAFWPWPP